MADLHGLLFQPACSSPPLRPLFAFVPCLSDGFPAGLAQSGTGLEPVPHYPGVWTLRCRLSYEAQPQTLPLRAPEAGGVSAFP